MICTDSNIEEFWNNIDSSSSLKPKLMIIFWNSLIMVSAALMYTSAKRVEKHHMIPKRRVNLMTMKQQTLVQVKLI